MRSVKNSDSTDKIHASKLFLNNILYEEVYF